MSEFNPYTSDPFAVDTSSKEDNPYQMEDDINQESITTESIQSEPLKYEKVAENEFNSAPISNAIPTNVYSGSANETKDKNLAIVSLVFGIISIITGCFCFGEIFAILAIILGSVYLSRNKNGNHKGMAIAGIVTAIVSIVMVVCLVVFVLLTDEEDLASDLSSSISYDIDEILNDNSENAESDYLDYINENEQSEYDESYSEELPDGNLKNILLKSCSILSNSEDIGSYVGDYYDDGWVTDYDSMRGWLSVEGYEYHDEANYEYYRDSHDVEQAKNGLVEYYDVKNPKAVVKKDGSMVYGVDESDETLIFLTCFLDDSDIQLDVTIFAFDDNDIDFAKKYLKHLNESIGISDFSKDIN